MQTRIIVTSSDANVFCPAIGPASPRREIYSLRDVVPRVAFLDSIYLQVRPRNRGLPLKVQIRVRIRCEGPVQADDVANAIGVKSVAELCDSGEEQPFGKPFATKPRKPSASALRPHAGPRAEGIYGVSFPFFLREDMTRRALSLIDAHAIDACCNQRRLFVSIFARVNRRGFQRSGKLCDESYPARGGGRERGGARGRAEFRLFPHFLL